MLTPWVNYCGHIVPPCDVLLLQHMIPWRYYSSTRCFTVNFLPVIFYYCNILTLWSFHTARFHPCDVFFTSATFHPRDVLLLQHFVPVTFYSCNIFIPIWYVRVTNTPSASRVSCHCVGTSTFFYLDRDKQATYAIKKNVDVLSHVKLHLEMFGLG
jgi:hypothetical protein